MAMRRPRKTPPLATWKSPYWWVELHRQKVGYVVWAADLTEGYGWEWGAFEAREDAEQFVTDQYDIEASDAASVPLR
jgi:hypothetical protein